MKSAKALKGAPEKPNFLLAFALRLREKAAEILKPEEVEVTFEEESGKIIGYTYTIVSHKHVA
jgi:hypothetical protein